MEVRVDKLRLRQIRQERAISQDALAQAAGLHPRTVQRIEASGIASLPSLRLLARALACEVSELEQVTGTDLDQDAAFYVNATLLQGVGAAFLWVAMSALVWVADAQPGALLAGVSVAGFASFCAGLGFIGEGWRRASLVR